MLLLDAFPLPLLPASCRSGRAEELQMAAHLRLPIRPIRRSATKSCSLLAARCSLAIARLGRQTAEDEL